MLQFLRFTWVVVCGMNMASGIKHTGLPMGCSYRPAAQRRLFGGKELDRTAGLNLYDQEARLYDPATMRMQRQDDYSEKYQPYSSYHYCLNNPMGSIEMHGDSVAVLIAPNGAVSANIPFGHMAILIQNENGEWEFYSKEGTDPEGQKPADNDETGKKKYDSPQTFLDQGGYTEAYVIASTPDEDKTAKTAVMNRINQKYSSYDENCAKAVVKSLESINKNKGSWFGITGYLAPAMGVYVHKAPNAIYQRIKMFNKGQTIRKSHSQK